MPTGAEDVRSPGLIRSHHGWAKSTQMTRLGHGLVVPLVPSQLFRPGFTDKMRGSLIVLVGLWPFRAGPAYGTVTVAGLRQLGGFIYRLAFIEGLPDDGHFGFAYRAVPSGQSAPTQDAARSTCRP